MARKKEEINPICGHNLKVLLSDNKMTQKELASKLNYTEQHLSLIITGNRRLTVEAARNIANLFPGTRYEWLMGYDEYRTDDDKISAKMDRGFFRAKIRLCFMRYFFGISGYEVKFIRENKKTLSENDYYGVFQNDKEIARLTTREYQNLQDEITHFALYQIDRLLNGRQERVVKPLCMPEPEYTEKGEKNG